MTKFFRLWPFPIFWSEIIWLSLLRIDHFWWRTWKVYTCGKHSKHTICSLQIALWIPGLCSSSCTMFKLRQYIVGEGWGGKFTAPQAKIGGGGAGSYFTVYLILEGKLYVAGLFTYEQSKPVLIRNMLKNFVGKIWARISTWPSIQNQHPVLQSVPQPLSKLCSSTLRLLEIWHFTFCTVHIIFQYSKW